MFLCVLNAEKYMAISWISHKVMLIDPNKPPQTPEASSQHPKASPDLPILPIHLLWPSQICRCHRQQKFARTSPTLPHTQSPAVVVLRTSYHLLCLRIHREESAANGMIQIGPEEGKKSRFCVWKCMNISLTHRWYVGGLLLPTMHSSSVTLLISLSHPFPLVPSCKKRCQNGEQ